MRPLEIWQAAAEMKPLAQTGGLADVVQALPQALSRRGHRVRVFLPACLVQCTAGSKVPAARWTEPTMRTGGPPRQPEG